MSRSGVASVLTTALTGSTMSFQSVKENTTLGTVQVQAMPHYAKRFGLLNSEKQPTLFGQLVSSNDPTLSSTVTQWVMHYFIAAPHRFAPSFWHNLVTSALTPGVQISTADLANMLTDFAINNGGDKPSERTVSGAANAFIGTYSKPDALGQLGILEPMLGGKYEVTEPEPISAGAFACVLADYWDNHWSDRSDVLLSDVTSGPLCRILLAEGRINDLLKELDERGIVRRQRRVPPYQISSLWTDSSTLWQDHLYS